ncbi:Phenylacetic acid degradation operon negative regulatory protein PaaX [hydrothermal vent metagenome]|uniref:Phenylacetic acid degradation operon negative regulatory protein PaaX n=1 Tax=hydrothermal vent metagenome TaxID=652676 RepID=A0A3B0TCC8_9ZZZZ
MMIAQHLHKLIEDFQSQQPLRVGSLIITVYGDLLALRGGVVWLGSVINLLEPLGINARHVRTATSRLNKDNWISPRQVGRKSYYSLTDSGRRRFQNATPQIYAGPRSDWNARWTLVILPDSKIINRDSTIKELGWLGFGKITKAILAHPMPDMLSLERTLDDLGIRNDVIILDQASHEMTSSTALDAMVKGCWNLEELSGKYRKFLDRYRPVYETLSHMDMTQVDMTQDNPAALDFLLIRTLMVHEYRKILLRDPRLPDMLMPTHWEGNSAYQLCRNIYQLLLKKSEYCLSTMMETEEGHLPPPDPEFFRRFGNLEQK